MRKLGIYTIYFFILFLLILLLYLNINNIKINYKQVYAKDVASSSVSSSKAEDGSDMVNLLARIINGEARGEPYLRASSSRCSCDE